MTFEDAYAAHGDQLKRWAAWRFGAEMADDVVQEGLLHAWENWETGATRPVSVKTWLFGVVKYTGIHMIRAGSTLSSREGKIAPFWGRNADNTAEWSPETKVPPARPSQGVALYVEQLRDHFANLGPAQEEVLNALADGETAKEYSERTGRSQQAVSGALQLGRKRLREALGDDRPHAWS